MTYWDGHWQAGHLGLIETLLVELPEISPQGVVSIVLAAKPQSERVGNPLSMKDVKSIIRIIYLNMCINILVYLNSMHVDIILYMCVYIICS